MDEENESGYGEDEEEQAEQSEDSEQDSGEETQQEEQSEQEDEEEQAQEEETQRQVMAQLKKKQKEKLTKKFVARIGGSVLSAVGAALPYILIGVLVFVAVLFLAASLEEVGNVFSNLFSGLFSGSGDSSESASFYGVTGDDFYGVRTVYKDETQAFSDIVGDYIDIIVEVKEAVESYDSLDVNITITLSLPYDETDGLTYDFGSAFVEDTFAAEYAELYQLLLDMAEVVYTYDITADGSSLQSSDVPTTLVGLVSGISYFGYNTSILDSFESTISSFLLGGETGTGTKYYSYEAKQSGGSATATETEVEDAIKSELSTTISSLKTGAVRTEKLYMQDHILSAGSAVNLYSLGVHEFVAYIFMPKKAVTFDSFSFALSCTDQSVVSVYIQYGDKVVSLEDGGSVDDDTNTYLYESSSNLGLSVSTFENIDTSNLDYLASARSLYEIYHDTTAYTTYLETATDDNGQAYYTWKDDGSLYLGISCDTTIGIAEYQTELA